MAVYKSKPLGEPTEIFSLYGRVLNGQIFCVPECVLGVEIAILYMYIFSVLEGIFSVQIKLVDIRVFRVEKQIGGGNVTVVYFYPVTLPAEFLGSYLGIVNSYIFAVSDSFNSVYFAAADG